jgi:hypothetical protein
VNHSERERLREAFQRTYRGQLHRTGLRERVLSTLDDAAARPAHRDHHWLLTAAAAAMAALVIVTLVLGGRLGRLAVPGAQPRGTQVRNATPATPPPTPVGPCRVPYVEATAAGPAAGHWLQQADGSVSDDAAATFDVGADGLVHSKASPVLVGTGPAFYDGARQRWLPVPRAAVSPDGSVYAYIGPGSDRLVTTVHMVDVATGHDRTMTVPGGPWRVLDFGEDGIYLSESVDGLGQGLWRLAIPSGQLGQVLSPDRTVSAVSGNIAWVLDVDPAAPAQTAGGRQLPNRLSQLDVRTGVSSAWMTTPNMTPQVIGYDGSGDPFVMASGPAGRELLLATAPQNVLHLTPLPAGLSDRDAGQWTAIADRGGDWVSGSDGLYRYEGSGLRRVVATGHVTHPANRCI